MKTIKISDDVLRILSTVDVEGSVVRLTCGQLDRKMYLEVNKVLELMGGKWNRKVKGHVFNEDPTDKLEEVLLTGEIVDIKKDYGYFPTPLPLVKAMIELADIEPGMEVLEPSAGQGNIADELRKLGCNVTVVEILPENRKVLEDKGYKIDGEDFLKYDGNGKLFDRVVMNPPFAPRQCEIDHVLHAYELLKPGGRLVSIMSNGITFRDNKKTRDFREVLGKCGGYWLENPDDIFKESGTLIRTVTVVMERY